MCRTDAPVRSATPDPTEQYWNRIKNTRPLSRKQEFELFQRARAGDEQARQKLVLANLRFVVRVAREYRDYGLSLIELISEGNLGLLEAIKRFDETRGFKFITYAVWWIRQAILRALSEQGRIARPPMSQLNDLQKIEKETGLLAQELGRTPTCEEIAARVKISKERTRNAWAASRHDLSLDAPAYPDDDTSLMTILEVEQEGADARYEKKQMKEILRACLEILDEREYQILRSYFGLEGSTPMTLEQIGEVMGITRERVRQLRNRALEKMRAQLGDLLVEFSSN